MTDQMFSSIYEAFESSAQKFQQKKALIYLGRHFTYRELENHVDRLARSLYQMGIKRQDKAIIFLPHCPEWVIIWLALQKIGAVVIPVTHFYGPRELHYIASDSGAETIFCTDTNFGYVAKILPDTPLKRIIINTIADFLPFWKKAIGHLYAKIPTGKYILGENTFLLRKLLKRNAPALPSAGIEGNDPAEILYTGGTIGSPKGVPISHNLFIESIKAHRNARINIIPEGTDIVLQGAPLFHILGQTLGLAALFSGDTLVMLPRMSIDAVLMHIQQYRATSLFGSPTLYQMLLAHERSDQYNLSSLVYNFSGGDVLPKEVARKWLKKFAKPIYDGYGATETCGGISLTPAGEAYPEGSAGKIVSFQKVKVVDGETLHEVPPGEPGELLVSSEHMVRGYWNQPEETKNHFVTLDGQLWYRTGDIVRIAQDGWLFFLDRSVDVIKHKGYRVAASKVDSVLQEHPAVVSSCTVGIPDENVGERIKAFVVVRQDIRGVGSAELIKWCKEKLAPYEIPQYIEFRDMLPKSKVGKLLRRELRTEERRKNEVS